MANVTVGSLVANNLLPIQARAAGSLSFGPTAIPAGFTVLVVLFDLQQVADLATAFTAAVEIAFDGVTWESAGGVGLDLSQSGYVLNGGVLFRQATDPIGAGPVRAFGQQVFLRHCDLTTRQIRGTLSASAPSTSGVTLMVF